MYNTPNIAELKEQCRLFMAEHGLAFAGELVSDGRIHRYSADAKRNKPDEYYVAHEGKSTNGNDYLICVFGSWSTGDQYEYKSFEQNKLSDFEKKEIRQIAQVKRATIEHTLKNSQDEAAKHAEKLWLDYAKTAPSNEYLLYTDSKGVKPIGEVRFGLNQQGYPSLIIPLKNEREEIRSLQYISLDNTSKTSYKSFLTGGEKKGNFHIIGQLTKDEETAFVVEGYATGVTVHQATKKPVIIAFDAGNLGSVIENIKKVFPNVAITIAADNDEMGIRKAREAADKLACNVMIPSFPKESECQNASDFNDLQQITGIDEVKKQLAPTISSATNLKALAENFLANRDEPCTDFKLSLLPNHLREYIASICKTTNAHPILVTSSVLTMVSAFVGTKAYIPESEYFQDLYPNLWILCIAKSGQFKSTALNKGAKISYDKQAEVFKAIKAMKDAPQTEDNEGLDKLILMKSRENVVIPTKLTAEALLEYLSEGHQGAIYASEFGGWLQNLDKTHNNDFKAIFTEFYDVPTFYRYKTKTQGDCIIECPFISICGVSTLEWITNNLKPTDVPSGFFARFLIFVPPYQEIIPPALPQPLDWNFLELEERFRQYIETILAGFNGPRKFTLSSEARTYINSIHLYIHVMPKIYSDRAGQILQPYLKRWSPYLLKLSLIMQLFIDPKSDEISGEAVLAARAILTPAMKSTASLFENELGESVHQRKCRILFDSICKKIKDTGKPIKRQTILSSKKLDGGSAEYDYVLTSLIDQGKIRYKEHPKKNESEYELIENIEKN